MSRAGGQGIGLGGMDIAHLKRTYSSIAGQSAALRSLRDVSCRDAIPPPAAVAFGVVPVDVANGKLVLATAGAIHPDCATALATALDNGVELVPFDEGLVREAIDTHYLRRCDTEHGPNLQTFESPDFLRDPASARMLLGEKSDILPLAKILTPRGRMAFLDLRFHSIHRSLDRMRHVRFTSAPAALPFRLAESKRGGIGAVLFRDERPSRGVKALMALSMFYDGDDHLHAVVGHDLKHLPHIIHPTELQLAEIEEDRARFWIYDRMESVEVGVPSADTPVGWSCRYYFLHYGTRHERTLHLDCLAFEMVRRTRIRLAGGADRPTPEALERLFGLDFPLVDTSGKCAT